LIWLRIGTGECGNELSDSIHCGVFLDYLKNCWLLTKDSAPWSQQQFTG